MGRPHFFDTDLVTKTEFPECLPSFCAAGASRSYASLLVKEARAFLVPETTASEHCSGCSTPDRIPTFGGHFVTSFRRRNIGVRVRLVGALIMTSGHASDANPSTSTLATRLALWRDQVPSSH
jgi:hypothetical protein